MAVLVLYMIVIALQILQVASDPVIVVSSPNLMRVGNEETVLVSVQGRFEPVEVTVKLKLFEHGNEGVISESFVAVGEDAVRAVLYVDPELIPSVDTGEELQRYVYITVSCPELNFDETKEVLLSYLEGFVFIQTDKPIYSPDQPVKIRVISLDQYLTPSSQKIQLDIVTPHEVIVERSILEENNIQNGIISTTFHFYKDLIYGQWKIVAHYGKDNEYDSGWCRTQYQLSVNKTVKFEVQNFVSPTFSVKIQSPNYILPTFESINIRVEARYTYGKSVRGRCFMKVGVKEEDEAPVILHSQGTQMDHAGSAEMEIETNLLGAHWFEENVGSSLYVEVTVVESATGHIQNSSDTSAKFVRSPYMFTMERTARYFKKGVPFEVKADVKFMNGKPAPGVRVKAIAATTIEGHQDEIILRGAQRDPSSGGGFEPTEGDTNDKGQINFRFFVPRQSTNIRISLQTIVLELLPSDDNPTDGNARIEFNIRSFESPNGNEFLVLRVPNQIIRPNVGELHVDVFLNSVTAAPVMNYFVISRGKIMEYGERDVANVDRISFPVSYEMVPSARIVAYYISDSGHIIADSVWIEIERECENPVRVAAIDRRGHEIGEEIIEPQDEISLRIRGSPGTSVALLAVDQRLLLLSGYNRLTPDKMYESMDAHDTGCGPGGGRTSADVFLNSGLMILTNLNLDVPRREGPMCALTPENKRRKRSLESQRRSYASNVGEDFACKRGHKRLGDGTCSEKAQRFPLLARNRLPQRSEEYQGLSEEEWVQLMEELMFVFTECCETAEAEANSHALEVDLTDPRFIITNPLDVFIFNDFRESWAFDIVEIPEDLTSVDQTYLVPGSITAWSLQAFGLHNNLAMCVPQPVNLVAARDLFIQLRLPNSVVRLEFVEIQVTLFNYGSFDIAVKMFLEVPDGICSDGTPGKPSMERNFVVEANDARTFTYMIVGLETGEFPVKVIALTTMLSDIVVKVLKVVPEGVTKTFQHTTILNPTEARINRNIQAQLQDELSDCGDFGVRTDQVQRNCLDISLPPSTVPHSASCFVSITASPLKAVFPLVIAGLESWIRLPTGSGEETMIRLAPNVYVLHYLTRTDSATDADKSGALHNTQLGITRALRYRSADGSFTVWPGYQSSTWLTAFVGKVFCQASEYTYVDPSVSCGAIEWLMTVQRSDGAFLEVYRVLHREMIGGVEGDTAMTAFALIAMNECQCVVEVPEIAASSLRATQFLEGQLNTIRRPYVIAIVTYALALVGSDRRFDANNMLKALASYDEATNSRSWATDASSLDPDSRPYWYQHRPSAISVETTSYALLAQLVLGEISYSHPIAQWLSQQQNYGGGFVSTQDLVIGLQALSEYASVDTGGNLNMHCNITAPENFKASLSLQEGDAHVQKTVKIPSNSITGKLLIETSGEGVGQLDIEVTYNDLRGNTYAECPFNLEISTVRTVGERGTPFAKGDKVRLRVCASYLGEERTNMAILDVGLYSGFEPVSESLRNIIHGDSLIERTEISDRSVIFYADHIPAQTEPPLCFEFEAVCNIVVGNLYNAAVHVYDYHNPEEECFIYYAPDGAGFLATLCSNDGMCSCISSQCAACSAPDGETADDLLEIACATTETYVYKIVVTDIETFNGFDIVFAFVERVIKRGEDYEIFENSERKFWVSSSCECPGMRRSRKYMVIGQNYLPYEEEVGLRGYKYIIDHKTTVRWWRRGRISRYLNVVEERIVSGNSDCI